MTASRAQRKRRGVELTLSPAAVAALATLAPGLRSELVDRLILDWARLVRSGGAPEG